MDIVDTVAGIADATAGKLAEFKSDLTATRRELADIRAAIQTKAASASPHDREHRDLYMRWIVDPALGSKALNEFVRDTKDTTLVSAIGGGFAQPRIHGEMMWTQARLYDPRLRYVRTVASGDFRDVLALADDDDAQTSSETGTRTATATSTLRARTPTWGEYYTYVTASNHALEDIPDLEAFLIAENSRKLAAKLSRDYYNGSGTNSITGLVTTAPVTTSDTNSPLRNANALQYVPLSGLNSPVTLDLYTIADLIGAFQDEYLLDPSFAIVMRPTTWQGIVKKQGLAEAAFAQGRPSLFNVPVWFSSAHPAPSANNFPVAAGAWQRAYTLVTRSTTSVVRDEVTNVGYTRWRFASRFGGIIRDNNAAKVVKFAAS